jgi:hypothetical protein
MHSKKHALLDVYEYALGKFLINYDENYLLLFIPVIRDRNGDEHCFLSDPEVIIERHHGGELDLGEAHAVLPDPGDRP